MSFFAGGVRLDCFAIHIANRLCIRSAKRRLVGIGPDRRADGEAVVVRQAFGGLAEERGVGSFSRIRAAEHPIDLGERLRLRAPCERLERNLEARRRGSEALAVSEADLEKPCGYGVEPLF